MDVHKTWQGWSNHGPAHAYRLLGQIRPEVEPRRRKNGSMRGPFSKGLLQIGMQHQQTECILVSWIEISWLFVVRTDFTNLTVMLSDLLRNLTFNRSAHCTQVSDQCPLGLLFTKPACNNENGSVTKGLISGGIRHRLDTFVTFACSIYELLVVNCISASILWSEIHILEHFWTFI